MKLQISDSGSSSSNCSQHRNITQTREKYKKLAEFDSIQRESVKITSILKDDFKTRLTNQLQSNLLSERASNLLVGSIRPDQWNLRQTEQLNLRERQTEFRDQPKRQTELLQVPILDKFKSALTPILNTQRETVVRDSVKRSLQQTYPEQRSSDQTMRSSTVPPLRNPLLVTPILNMNNKDNNQINATVYQKRNRGNKGNDEIFTQEEKFVNRRIREYREKTEKIRPTNIVENSLYQNPITKDLLQGQQGTQNFIRRDTIQKKPKTQKHITFVEQVSEYSQCSSEHTFLEEPRFETQESDKKESSRMCACDKGCIVF